jgi:hypothetical protein
VRGGLSRPMAVISLWGASGVCTLLALAVYKYPDQWGTQIIGGFGILWVVGLALFLRTRSAD